MLYGRGQQVSPIYLSLEHAGETKLWCTLEVQRAHLGRGRKAGALFHLKFVARGEDAIVVELGLNAAAIVHFIACANRERAIPSAQLLDIFGSPGEGVRVLVRHSHFDSVEFVGSHGGAGEVALLEHGSDAILSPRSAGCIEAHLHRRC